MSFRSNSSNTQTHLLSNAKLTTLSKATRTFQSLKR